MQPIKIEYMMKHLFSATITFSLLFAAGCQKSDLKQQTAVEETISGARLSTAQTTSVCDIIDFSGIAHGTVIEQVQSKNQNWTIGVSGYNPEDLAKGGTKAAMVLNSAGVVKGSNSQDMGTPNEKFGGPGVGAAGEGGAFANMVAWGNILVIKDFDSPVIEEDDTNGAFTSFDFSSVGKITAKSLSVIDVELTEQESAYVYLYASKSDYDNKLNPLNKITLPSTGQNGVATVSLGNTTGVGFIVVDMNGSMGIDNLEFCKDSYVPAGCSYTQGFWKTHGPDAKGNNSNMWPNIQSMTLGSVLYTASEWQSIFNQPVAGNGLISLAHQLIAARLNIANGANGSSISSVLSDADALIGSLVVPPVGDGSLSTSAVSALVEKLTQFNEGTLPGGPKHCN
jgi:hypothetical protein